MTLNNPEVGAVISFLLVLVWVGCFVMLVVNVILHGW